MLFIQAILYFSMTILSWLANDCRISPLIKIFSETSMFIWILNLNYTAYHFICFNSRMIKINWILFSIFGYVLPFTLSIICCFVLDIDNEQRDERGFCVFNVSNLSRIYFFSTGILQFVLYILCLSFFIKIRILIKDMLSIQEIQVKLQYFLVFRFIMIHFFIYIFSIITRILSFIITDLNLTFNISFLLSNSLGIFYLLVFIYTYFFDRKMIISGGTRIIINETENNSSFL